MDFRPVKRGAKAVRQRSLRHRAKNRRHHAHRIRGELEKKSAYLPAGDPQAGSGNGKTDAPNLKGTDGNLQKRGGTGRAGKEGGAELRWERSFFILMSTALF